MHKHGWATRTGALPNIYGFTASSRLLKKMQNGRKTRQSLSKYVYIFDYDLHKKGVVVDAIQRSQSFI